MFKIFSYHGDFSDANHFMICYDDILSYCTHLYVEIRRLASIILCTFTKIYIYMIQKDMKMYVATRMCLLESCLWPYKKVLTKYINLMIIQCYN